ncbi:MAG: two-component system, NarL family, sensor histidine kinase UhpB [Solirubrobacterales bacterium]|jgi:two-component system sensor histidine kinase UhpB|nr:two-component system, NarL family, sensor histidine kinase UhpB [Solirubrobacterales bacterium]
MTQVLAVNLLLIVAAVVAATIATSPKLALSSTPEAGLVLGLAVALTVMVNVFLLQRRMRPLEQLVDEMERADLSRPGANLSDPAGLGEPEEVERLHKTFRRMLERLETERRRASSAALTAQEEERTRIARDLHDEVNQSLTGLLLRLEAVREHAPYELAKEIDETKALANQAMQELLTLARQLRPTALDDLGLKAALAGNVSELDRQSALEVTFQSDASTYSDLSTDAQLVVYRVAQEALSNAAQHAEAQSVQVNLARMDGTVELTVTDDGRGFTFDQASRGLGMGGMRERALLVGGDLRIESRPSVGTRVRLRVPIENMDGSLPPGKSSDHAPGVGRSPLR